jgi:hypothetical protein
MKTYFKSFFIKALFKTALCLSGLMMYISTIANDGRQPSSVAAKVSAPVNYYQAFMLSIAVSYGIYLIVRARRRKRNSKITE